MTQATNSNNEVLTEEVIKEARHRLWHMGELTWKLDTTQLKIYNFYKDCPDKTIVINCSRRLGKSFFLVIMAVEQCLRKPNSIVKMLQPELKMVRTNIRPIMDRIFRDCPEDLRPQFKTQDNIYLFSNGSEMQLAGSDNGNYEKLRGGDAHLCIIDEAGFISADLSYIIKSVLVPTTTLTGGRIILSSTTPMDPENEFIKYMEMAEVQGRLIRKTIDDAVEDHRHEPNPRITPGIVEDVLKSYDGGRDSDEFRTEYLCMVIKNSSRSVIPEFTEVKNDIVSEWGQPVFCDRYTSMDIGFKDLTAVLFAYYDFDNAVLVIEDEYSINGPQMDTKILAENIQRKEKALWTNKMTGEQFDPYRRVSDNNLILINDLYRLHGMLFFPTEKDNKDMQINNVRIAIRSRQVIINPRCKQLISHLENATWNKTRNDYTRSPDNGHYDFVDALVYLIRNLDKNRNPYPKGYRHSKMGNPNDLFFNPHYKPAKVNGKDTLKDHLENQFKVKSSIHRSSKK